jgi:hypothetical protein
MAQRNRQRLHWRRPTIALAIFATAAVLPVPAGAQFFGSHYQYGQRQTRPPPPQRGYFSFPFFGGGGGGDQFNPFYRPAPPPVESYKAPPPRKLETPPTSTVLVIGDTMADWLAYGLEETLADSPEIGVARNIRPTSGLMRYDAKNDSLEWSGIVKDFLATEKPSAIVVMLGLNDRMPFRDKAPPRGGQQQAAPAAGQAAPAQPQAQDKPPDGEQPSIMASEPQRPGPAGSYEFHTDKWAELYAKRIDETIAALKSKGVPVFWVGLPAIRGTKSTADMVYLNDLYRGRAEKAGIIYIDVWDGFVDENGNYVPTGPDFEGQIRRLRAGDGVHFTKAGARKLAHYVEREIRRVMLARGAPVAMPVPEEKETPAQAPSAAKPGGPPPRPVAGPVVPLTGHTGPAEALIGGGPARGSVPDATASKVLVKGDAVTAPAGRADNFAWPRPDALPPSTSVTEPTPEPAALATSPTEETKPAAPPPKKTVAKRPPSPFAPTPLGREDQPRPPGAIPRSNNSGFWGGWGR